MLKRLTWHAADSAGAWRALRLMSTLARQHSNWVDMRIGAVVFDMDGLVLDTEPVYKIAWQQASAELGFDLDDSAYGLLTGRPTEDCEAELLTRFGLKFPLEIFRNRWPEIWHALVRDRGIPHKPGLMGLLSFLKARSLPIAIATSSDAEYADFSLQCAGLRGRFPVVVTREQVAKGKPAPDIYIEAARRLGQRTALCMALEDSDVGVFAAVGAGMATVCVPDLKPPSDAAVRAAFRVVGSLVDVRDLIEETLADTGQAG